MVPVDSVQIPRGWTYSGTPRESNDFRIRGCHPLWPTFPDRSANHSIGNSHVKSPTTPRRRSSRFGLFPFRSPLLRKSIFLSVPMDTEIFQFSTFATCNYVFIAGLFGNLGINTCLTTTPSLSQSSTPFEAS